MKKLALAAIFLINLGIIIYLWSSQSVRFLSAGQAGLFISLGRLVGLLAVYLVLWQLVLIGRARFIEQTFGFDRLAAFHRLNGLIAWIFIFLHPFFIILGRAKLGGVSFLGEFLSSLSPEAELGSAFIAVLIFTFIIIISFGAMRRKLKYEAWHYIHFLTYLAIILAFGHQLEMGYDLQKNWAAAYWYLLYAIAILPLIYYRLLWPAFLYYRHRFQVARVVRENPWVISVYISGRQMDRFYFRGGQFIVARFLSRELAWQAHPFSLSQAFNGKELRLTIKNLGDYTASLPSKLRPGQPVWLEGPYGIFTGRRAKGSKLALIAGGIGITPIRSLIEDSPDKDKVLVYSARQMEEMALKPELDSLAGHNLRNEYLDSSSGRLDKDKLSQLLPDYQEREFYLCGPWPMISAVRKALRELGIKRNRIYFEKFSLG